MRRALALRRGWRRVRCLSDEGRQCVGKTKVPLCRSTAPNALVTLTDFRCSEGRSANHLPLCDKQPKMTIPATATHLNEICEAL
jgi:hypothetical protein